MEGINGIDEIKAYKVKNKFFTNLEDAIRYKCQINIYQANKDNTRNNLKKIESDLKNDLEKIKSNTLSKMELYKVKARYYSNKIKLEDYIKAYKEYKQEYKDALLEQRKALEKIKILEGK